METLFQFIKRIVPIVCRRMAFQDDFNHSSRRDERHSFLMGDRINFHPTQHQQLSYIRHWNDNIPHVMHPYGVSPPGVITRRRHRRTRDCRFFVAITVFNVMITCGIVFSLLYTLKVFNSPLLCSGTSSSDCISCPEKSRNIGLNCCSSIDRTELQKLIDKMSFIEEHKHRQTGGNFSSNPSISTEKCGALFHLNGKNEATNSELSVVRKWSTQGNVPYRFPCIEYDDSRGEFTVNIPGYYIVYSHLAFEWNDSDSRSIIVQQRIQAKQSIGSNGQVQVKTIASDSRATQKVNPQVGFTPSYNSRTMVVVRLMKGTVLTVEAMPMNLLMSVNSYSSFGLFKL